ncbi:MAG: hypothetical protein HY260_15835, partial [Chloroflexi bacterium]|nr:hypothetical protein [Chloroflexota bacterium]
VSFNYDEDGEPLSAIYGPDSPFYGLALTNRLDPVYGRDRLVLDAQLDGNTCQVITGYQYDPGAGRLKGVQAWFADQSGASSTNTTSYGYLANSDLVRTVTAQAGLTTVATTTKTWDYGYRLRSLRSVLGTAGAAVSSWAYDYDDADRRTHATLADGSAWGYDYDSRNEVIAGKRSWADLTAVAGQQFAYAYDNIGNRTQTKEGGDNAGVGLRPEGYAVNSLNQYTARTKAGTMRAWACGRRATRSTASTNTPPAPMPTKWTSSARRPRPPPCRSMATAASAATASITRMPWRRAARCRSGRR